MDGIGPDDVAHIADLARLDLTPEELAEMSAQFQAILGHLESLAAVDTTGVEPLDHPLPMTDVLREDVPGPTLDRGAWLPHAPDSAEGQVRVPAIRTEDGS